ncbi:recombination protein RecT [Paenibacillus rigui]|uniref:Recombinase RecT n=1 Tax=Paenibacillus rigui TaxID=554312 RepID=A0A229UM93_9BACL|nr:recombination protein RecT [Paenibacillus rigui]OXM84587.1 recombinase RecT [Paenibacillus rigui]
MAGNSSTQDQLAGKLQQRAAGGNTPVASPANTIAAYLKKMEGEIARALPKHMTPERMTRIALTTIRTNPKLLECTVPSLIAAVMQSAQLGLEPGLIGHCYFVPYNNKKKGLDGKDYWEKEVQFMIGYKGMIDLARRSGNIQSISAHEVYENDFIELTYGLQEDLKHIPWFLRKDQKQQASGDVTGAYMVAKFNDGGHFIHYMPIQEIESHRARSKSKDNGPWITDYTEMCKKTVVRAGWKWLPISIEIASAVTKDETAHNDISGVTDDTVIDITATTVLEEDRLTDPVSGDQRNAQNEMEFE